MTELRYLLPSGRALRVLDVLVALWTAIWIALALAVSAEVRGLRQLSGTATRVGVAVTETGQALETLQGVPIVGDKLTRTARDIQTAGRSTVASGKRSRQSVHRLSWMLGLCLAVIPTVPLLVFYVPARIAFRRERRALGALAAARGGERQLRHLLAERALLNSSYQELLASNGDLLEKSTDELAGAELTRLGLPDDLRGL